MAGTGLALAAITAAMPAWRAPADHSVLLVSDHVVVVKGQGEHRSPARVVGELLRAQASGSTDLALGLAAARTQLARSPCRRSRVILLSDGRDTTGRDPLPLARSFEHLAVVEPAEARPGRRPDPHRSAAWELARASGARFLRLRRAEDVPGVVEQALRR
jgi:Mg-chelatase subunit ChlD